MTMPTTRVSPDGRTKDFQTAPDTPGAQVTSAPAGKIGWTAAAATNNGARVKMGCGRSISASRRKVVDMSPAVVNLCYTDR